MAKTAQDIIREQLGELTMQLCISDADRALLREVNARLEGEIAVLKEDIAALKAIRPVPGQTELPKGVQNGQ